jgi:hypothetical protein
MRLRYTNQTVNHSHTTGLYAGDGTWLITCPAHQITYDQYASAVNGPLLTRNPKAEDNTWDGEPRPAPVHHMLPVTLRIRAYGGDMLQMPALRIEEQIIELPEGRDGVVKHMLGGKVSIRLVRRDWSGPFVSIMPDSNRKQYLKLFQSYDLDGGGTIDTGELAEAFKQFGLKYTAEEVIDLMKQYNTLGDFELTFDEFCEMMEAEINEHKAWFVSSLRFVIPEGMSACGCVCVCVNVCLLGTSVGVHTCVCLCTYMYVCKCMRTCLRMCMYIYAYEYECVKVYL